MSNDNIINKIISNNPSAVANNLAKAGLVKQTIMPNGVITEPITYTSFVEKVRAYVTSKTSDLQEQARITAEFLNVQPLANGPHFYDLSLIRQKMSLPDAVSNWLLQGAGSQADSNSMFIANGLNGERVGVSSTQLILFMIISTIVVVGAYTTIKVVLKSFFSIFKNNQE